MLQTNLELKASINEFTAVERALQGLGFERSIVEQQDRYLLSNGAYVKVRSNDGNPEALISYTRQVSPNGRPSNYSNVDISGLPQLATALEAVADVGLVTKTRIQFRRNDVIINLDNITDVGCFVEIEVISDFGDAQYNLDFWISKFYIKPHEIIPYSNIHLVNMFAASRKFASDSAKGSRKILAVDGSSASGKSTLKAALLANADGKLAYVKRDTTRAPRPDDAISKDYRFVTANDYFESSLLGRYIEFRDYDFSMSYGVRWAEVRRLTTRGAVPLLLINLGNGAMVKRLLPDAIVVLLVADPDVVEARLRSRGRLREDQISERVANASLASAYAPAYDIVIDTGAQSVNSIVDRLSKEVA